MDIDKHIKCTRAYIEILAFTKTYSCIHINKLVQPNIITFVYTSIHLYIDTQ